jgi:hypothetical protein
MYALEKTAKARGSRVPPRLRLDLDFRRGWEDLVRRYDDVLRMQVVRTLRGAGLRPRRELVDERVQEVYCRLLAGGVGRLRRLRRWRESQVVSYLTQTAQRIVLDELRNDATLKRGRGVRIAYAGRLAELADRAVDPRASPEQEALRRDLCRLLLARCSSLVDRNLCPEDRRRALRVLRRSFLEGWSCDEIVRAEGGRLAASTVHGMVFRMRRRLRKSLIRSSA